MQLSRTDAAHLLRRTGFAPTAAEVDAVTGLERESAVDQILAAATASRPAPANPRIDSSASRWTRYTSMVHWWFNQMLSGPSPLLEKMTLFWHGHFTSNIKAVVDHQLMVDQNQLFRRMALGNFTDLAQAVALDPAMLLFLDNHRNVAKSPNENFARELMELFTLGVDQYSQDDVVASARAWTGYGLTPKEAGTRRYEFHGNLHDYGSKTIFGITKAWSGPEVITEITTGSKKDVHARYLATRLWTFFAHPDPSPAVVDALAAAYLAAGNNIAALLRALFLRDEFWSSQARLGLVRSPVEYQVATMRYTGLGPEVLHPEWSSDNMGQEVFQPPDVAGWKANRYWISSAAIWGRDAFARHAMWRAKDAGLLANTADVSVEVATQQALDTFGIFEPSPQTRLTLEGFLRAERAARGWGQQPYLTLLTLISPDYHLA